MLLNFSSRLQRLSSVCRVGSLFTKRSINGVTPMDTIHNLKENVRLYSCGDKRRRYMYLGVFGIGQALMWSYWGCSMYSDLKNVGDFPYASVDSAKSTLWRRINLGDQVYRIGVLVTCLTVGIVAASVTLALPLRMVKSVILQKGAQNTILETYGPFGKIKTMEVPLNSLNCLHTRQGSSSYLSLKVKGKAFYFLLDQKGTFHDPHLFDITVGASSGKIKL